jgi:hypothetical protein
MAEDSEGIQNEQIVEPYTLRGEEEQWLKEQELKSALVEAVYGKFHEMFDTDDGRDFREFQRLLGKYQAGNQHYRAGVDRAMVALTGYRLLSLMKMASETPEGVI